MPNAQRPMTLPTLLDAPIGCNTDRRDNTAAEPMEAAVEIGLLEPDVLDDMDYKPLNFHDGEN